MQLSSQHVQMMGVLQRRLDQMQKLKDLWSRGNIASIRSVLNMPQDQAVLCDFARVVMRQNLDSALNLDACQALLPILRELLSSKYPEFVDTALEFGEVLLLKFGKLIAETRTTCARIPERQLDLPREERLRKCSSCYDQFQAMGDFLATSPPDGPRARFPAFNVALKTFLGSC